MSNSTYDLRIKKPKKIQLFRFLYGYLKFKIILLKFNLYAISKKYEFIA